MTLVKRRKGWRMNCDVGEVTERLENESLSFSDEQDFTIISECKIKLSEELVT